VYLAPTDNETRRAMFLGRHWFQFASKPKNRCLVGAQLCRIRPEVNPDTKKRDVVWFALSEDRPLFALADIWTAHRRWNMSLAWRVTADIRRKAFCTYPNASRRNRCSGSAFFRREWIMN
jgi:putative SOS response-associated peptidase YedK